jgi:hypothetical protein
MKKKTHLISAVLTLLLLFGLTWEAAASPHASQTPPGPPPIALYFAIDHFGTISISTGSAVIPEQVAQLDHNPSVSELNSLGARLLIVRFDNRYSVFNLQGRPVSKITFDRGYYQADRLYAQGVNLVLNTSRAFVRNEAPNEKLHNLANLPVATGRRSCLETAFRSNMKGVVLNPVRLRKFPYIPMELDSNWLGSLQSREVLFILQTYCNAGSWLRIERASGEIGWAKEWGLTEKLQERTFIAPYVVQEE